MWCWGGIAPFHLPLPFPPAAEGASPFRPAPCVRVMLPSGTARLDLMALPRRKTGDRCCQGPRRGWEYRDIFFWSCLNSRDGQFHLINCHVATLDCRSRSISALQPLGAVVPCRLAGRRCFWRAPASQVSFGVPAGDNLGMGTGRGGEQGEGDVPSCQQTRHEVRIRKDKR